MDPETLIWHAILETQTQTVVERPKPKGDTPSEPLRCSSRSTSSTEVFKHLVPNKQGTTMSWVRSIRSWYQGVWFLPSTGWHIRKDRWVLRWVLGCMGFGTGRRGRYKYPSRGCERKCCLSDLATQRQKNSVQPYYYAVNRELARYYRTDKGKRLANERGVNMDYLVDHNFMS